MIFLTGSSGFIGSNFAKYYIENNIKFRGIDKKKNNYLDSKYFIKLDLLNKKKLFKLFAKYKPKIVLHLAADSGLNYCHLNQNQSFKNNVEATFNLLQSCVKYSCKNILMASSMAAENYNENPSFYGFTKITSENLLNTYRKKYGLNSTILRFSNIFGIFSSHKSSAVHQMIKCLIDKKKNFEIHGTGKQKRDFLYSENLVLKTQKILKKRNRKFLYDVRSLKKYSVNQILSLIQSLDNKNIKSKKIRPPLGYDVTFDKQSENKISKSLKRDLIKTINWYKDNK